MQRLIAETNRTMLYIDFHTHHLPTENGVVAVVDGRDTWGIHPWRAYPQHLPEERGESKSFPLEEDLGEASRCLAIGECGLDALRGASMERQEEVFLQHIALSERLGKPLIVHCVKALDRLLRLRREQKPTMPWMLHGFRGKPQQLRSLLDAGFYIGFGFRHNAESLRLCPAERLLLETDDQPQSITLLYRKVAEERGIEVADLCDEMGKNYRKFFSRHPLPL